MAQQLILVGTSAGSTDIPTTVDVGRTAFNKVNANFTEIYDGKNIFTDSIVLPKESGKGIKVDPATPTFCWKDLLGHVVPAERWQTDTPRTDVPEWAAINGTYSKALAYKAADKIDQILYHIPHDYVPGSDLFMHMHWTHNGTAISGSFVCNHYFTYAKGHNQALFIAELNHTHTILTPDIATVPRLQHRLDEFQLSTPGGDIDMLDTDLIEPDVLINVGFVTTTIPTITGGSVNKPFIVTLDIHYLSTGIGTKNKTPNFYT